MQNEQRSSSEYKLPRKGTIEVSIDLENFLPVNLEAGMGQLGQEEWDQVCGRLLN